VSTSLKSTFGETVLKTTIICEIFETGGLINSQLLGRISVTLPKDASSSTISPTSGVIFSFLNLPQARVS